MPAYRDTFVALNDDATRARISRMNRAALDREFMAACS
jgi:hypothetical protein